MTRKKIIIIILCWTLTAAWAAVIFAFSAQPAQESASLSGDTVKVILKVYNAFADGELPVETVYLIETVIRKVAHFGVYAVLGGLLFISLVNTAAEKSGKYVKRAALSAAAGLLYAASDEFHQLFVPGRSGQLSDVLLDFCGTLTGILFIYLIIKAADRHVRKKAEKGV